MVGRVSLELKGTGACLLQKAAWCRCVMQGLGEGCLVCLGGKERSFFGAFFPCKNGEMVTEPLGLWAALRCHLASLWVRQLFCEWGWIALRTGRQ